MLQPAGHCPPVDDIAAGRLAGECFVPCRIVTRGLPLIPTIRLCFDPQGVAPVWLPCALTCPRLFSFGSIESPAFQGYAQTFARRARPPRLPVVLWRLGRDAQAHARQQEAG